MAIILATTKDTVTLVHCNDPDVKAKEGQEGFIPVGDAAEVGKDATRVTIRPLAGHEILATWGGSDFGAKCVTIVLKAVVKVDGQTPDEMAIREWGWDVLRDLKVIIEDLSTGPTVARL